MAVGALFHVKAVREVELHLEVLLHRQRVQTVGIHCVRSRPGGAGNVPFAQPRQILRAVHCIPRKSLSPSPFIHKSHNVPASLRPLLPSPTPASAFSISPVFTSRFGCTCVCTGASASVFLQVVTMTTGAVVSSHEVVTELRAARVRVVLTFVKV